MRMPAFSLVKRRRAAATALAVVLASSGLTGLVVNFASPASADPGTVTAQNQGPFTVVENTPFSEPAGTLQTGVTDTDPNSEVSCCTAVLNSAPSNGTVTVNADGWFKYTPDSSFTGSDSFTYVLTDSDGNVSSPATVTITISPFVGTLEQVDCSDTTHCWTVGSTGIGEQNGNGVVLTTVDGGQTWQIQTLLSGNAGGLGAIFCLPASTDCWAGGDSNQFFSTTDGTTWSAQTLPWTGVSSIYCLNTSTCWADNGNTGGGIWTTTDGGSSWTEQSSGGSMDQITCLNASDCYAVSDSLYSTTDGGATWDVQSPPGGGKYYGIACVSVSQCWAVGGVESGTIIATTDGGTTWTTQLTPPLPVGASKAEFRGISCLSATDCWAAGGMENADGQPNAFIYVTHDGTTWIPVAIPGSAAPYTMNSMECPTAAECFSAGEYSGGSDLVSIGVSSGGVATVSDDDITVQALGGTDGIDTVTEAQYGPDPVGALTDGTNFFDFALSAGNTFTSAVIQDCNGVTASTSLSWWDPSANGAAGGGWEPIEGDPGPTYEAGPPGCLSATLDGSSSPTPSEMTGTVLGTTDSAPAPKRPAAPVAVKALSGSTTTGAGSLSVAYSTVSNGGSPITSYTATCTSSNSGVTKTGTHTGAAAAPITVRGVTTGKTYRCTVKAHNAVGTGAASAASTAVIVGSPAAPTGVSAAEVRGEIKVTFTIGANNGSAITSQTATCTSSNGGAAKSGTHNGAAAAPITVTGVTAGKTYRCTVTTKNARGASLQSSPSGAVTA